MEITSPITAILGQKTTEIWSINPDSTVFEAITMMADRNVGALPVIQSGKLRGIFSERDYTRKVFLKGRSSKETRVSDIMTTPAVTASPHDSVDRCMRIMTRSRVRHLPVVDGENVVGIVSIGDLVNWIISVQTAAIDQLEKYITGEYPG